MKQLAYQKLKRAAPAARWVGESSFSVGSFGMDNTTLSSSPQATYVSASDVK